jgi:hypothetical protein
MPKLLDDQIHFEDLEEREANNPFKGRTVSLEDFEIREEIGKGSYG